MTIQNDLHEFLTLKKPFYFLTSIAGEPIIFRRIGVRLIMAPTGSGSTEYEINERYLRDLQKAITTSSGKQKDQFTEVLRKIDLAKTELGFPPELLPERSEGRS